MKCERRLLLFVPATRRNAALLRKYAESCMDAYDCKFLRTTAFGEVCDTGERIGSFEIVTAGFLMHHPGMREFDRIRYQRKYHSTFRSFLKEISPALVVVGWDWDAIGRWTCVVAKDEGIGTLGLEEGGYICEHSLPRRIRLKRAFFNTICALYYKGSQIRPFYHYARYSAVWGEFDRMIALRSGVQESRIKAIGYPGNITSTVRDTIRKLAPPETILYLDFPAHTVPAGTFDYAALQKFRTALIQEVQRLKCRLIYKVHPLTRKRELGEIRSLLQSGFSADLVCEGIAEELYQAADVCLTFPSTCLYTAVEARIPVIQIHPDFKGFKTIILDIEREYSAGLTIRRVDQLEIALIKIQSQKWNKEQQRAYENARRGLLGPDDGKAGTRFRAYADEIVAARI